MHYTKTQNSIQRASIVALLLLFAAAVVAVAADAVVAVVAAATVVAVVISFITFAFCICCTERQQLRFEFFQRI